MIALKRYIKNSFDNCDIEVADSYIEVYFNAKHADEFNDTYLIYFNLDDRFIAGDIPVETEILNDIFRVFEKLNIPIKETHNHFPFTHVHFDIPLNKENIDKITELVEGVAHERV